MPTSLPCPAPSWLDALPGWIQAVGALLALGFTVYVVKLQAGYARKQLNESTATRIRSLARLVSHMAEACERAHAIRAGNPKGLDVDGLNLNLNQFNWAASELNKFNFVDAPSDLVFTAFTQYRDLCGPLSDGLHPNAPTTPEGLAVFFQSDREPPWSLKQHSKPKLRA
jgi:hypothetical protein